MTLFHLKALKKWEHIYQGDEQILDQLEQEPSAMICLLIPSLKDNLGFPIASVFLAKKYLVYANCQGTAHKSI